MSVNGGPQYTPFPKPRTTKSNQPPKDTTPKATGHCKNNAEQPPASTGSDPSATLDERHQGPRETVASENRHPLSWQYFPVPGLHMGHGRELLRPEKGQPATTPPVQPPAVPENTTYPPVVEAENPPPTPTVPEENTTPVYVVPAPTTEER